MHAKLWSENLQERDPSKDLGIDGSMLMDLRERGWGDVDWIHLTQYRGTSGRLL
jgi:hypothetical protein